MAGSTTNFGWPYPNDERNVSDPQADIAALAVAVDAAGHVRTHGKSIIATSETTSSTSYTFLTTPDRVQSVVLPTDGLIAVAYQATWQASSAAATAHAAIFIGSNQIKLAISPSGAPSAVQASNGSSANSDYPLATAPGFGLLSDSGVGGYGGDATTGQVISPASSLGIFGGPCYLFAAAGTYDIGVKFQAASGGTVTAKNRKLWVWSTF